MECSEKRFWFNQTINLLLESTRDLSYAFGEDYFSEETLKIINSKARELGKLIPTWNNVPIK